MNPGKKNYGGLNLSASVGAEEKQADLETILKPCQWHMNMDMTVREEEELKMTPRVPG